MVHYFSRYHEGSGRKLCGGSNAHVQSLLCASKPHLLVCQLCRHSHTVSPDVRVVIAENGSGKITMWEMPCKYNGQCHGAVAWDSRRDGCGTVCSNGDAAVSGVGETTGSFKRSKQRRIARDGPAANSGLSLGCQPGLLRASCCDHRSYGT